MSLPILVVTATPVERDAVLGRLEPSEGHAVVRMCLLEGSVYYVGRLGSTEVLYLAGSAGSGGRDGSGLNVSDALREWGSSVVLMPGIAFGADDEDGKKQRIGDVLVASKIFPYEVLRVGATETIKRGGAPESSRGLFNAATNVPWSWEPGKADERRTVQAGPLLSGPLLVDNAELKALLFKEWPDAIGGEMEGYGVQSAADRHGAEWLLCKAICDWGVGKSRDKAMRQQLAARNSVDFLCVLLGVPGIATDALPRGAISIRAHPLEAVRSIIRDTNGRVTGQTQALARMLAAAPRNADGSIELGIQKPILEMELAATKSAVEAQLNAYNDACLLAQTGGLDFDEFRRMFGDEIKELVTMDGFHQERLHPRETSKYKELWAVYDRLG